MLSFIGLALLVALFLLLLPYIIAFAIWLVALVLCLVMAGICWIGEWLNPTKKKPTR